MLEQKFLIGFCSWCNPLISISKCTWIEHSELIYVLIIFTLQISVTSKEKIKSTSNINYLTYYYRKVLAKYSRTPYGGKELIVCIYYRLIVGYQLQSFRKLSHSTSHFVNIKFGMVALLY